jgi:integrase
MSSNQKFLSKKKHDFNKIKVYNTKKDLLLKDAINQKNINYVIPESKYCGVITANTKFYNEVTRGCLKAIYSLRSLNSKKVINLPKLKLPKFITEAAFNTLWEITSLKPEKNFKRCFKGLMNEDPFKNAYAILLELLCSEYLQDVDLFKNTESMVLHEVWVWDATYSKDLSCWVVFLMEVSSRCILGCFAMGGVKANKPTGLATLQLLQDVCKELRIYPKVLHSDLGTEFNNKLIKSYCKINRIDVSFYGNDASAFGNQFVENLNGKFKNVFLKTREADSSIEETLRSFCINHNTSQHRGNLSPNSPIVVYYSLMNTELEAFPLKVALSNHISNSSLAVVKSEQASYFKNSLLIPERAPLNVDSLTYGEGRIVQGLIDIQVVLETKIDEISRTNKDLQSQVAELLDYQNRIIAEKLRKTEAKYRLKSRRRVTDRDCISLEQFDYALTLVEKSSKPLRLKNSLCLGMGLMYFFGIRVSNCLILDNSFFEELLSSKKEIQIPTVKTRVYLTTTKPGEHEIDTYFRPYIEFLLNGEGNAIRYDRSYWNREVNLLLKKLPGNIKSHSFRINLISQAWSLEPDILTISNLIGHSSSKITEGYISKENQQRARKVLGKKVQEKLTKGN